MVVGVFRVRRREDLDQSTYSALNDRMWLRHVQLAHPHHLAISGFLVGERHHIWRRHVLGGPNAFGSVNVINQMNQVPGTGIIPAGCFGGGKG